MRLREKGRQKARSFGSGLSTGTFFDVRRPISALCHRADQGRLPIELDELDMGDVITDIEGQVISEDGSVIDGLYSAGKQRGIRDGADRPGPRLYHRTSGGVRPPRGAPRGTARRVRSLA